MATNAAAGDAPPHVVEDSRGAFRVLSDGTVVRSTPPIAGGRGGVVPADPSVEWKDSIYDAALGLRLRIYKPAAAGGERKLPVVVYFHGGGFCIGSYAWPIIHAACSRLAAGLGAVVLSADYRLAPEHRLSAAIDDAAAALLWLRDHSTADPWLAEHADATRTFDQCIYAYE
ncbi:putative carboxylesterase 15 [Panicum miliaceum]|uniref:Carboxylesterase 15 n=1 Tax=Panicum miliaceum TaxID=4540 RepID=A0A3L6QS97_PANMI|nr:putative carboxylesterase 15 [Panicum miliaceum]